jgi:hypothetical protein
MVESAGRICFGPQFFDREKISFSLLKVVPRVKDWWDTYFEQKAREEYAVFVVAPTWDSFRDAIKEQYYPVGSCDDQYTKWTTLRQERDHTILDFTNIFHTLRTNWVSNIMSVIWCSNKTSICINIFK